MSGASSEVLPLIGLTPSIDSPETNQCFPGSAYRGAGDDKRSRGAVNA
jgi:hypothetical protein